MPANRNDNDQSMPRLLRELYPLHRSIAGEGLRQTVKHLQTIVPLKCIEVPSGTKVLDWEVPNEWMIRDAYIQDQTGHRLADYRTTNLCVLNHSQPVRQKMSWRELRSFVHSVPECPDWTPYRTAFFRDRWGFCLPDRIVQQLEGQPDAEFEVVIDAEFHPGSMTLAELHLPGQETNEILIHTHTCHPSLANDNLSSIVVAAFLARELARRTELRYSYRFLFAPATIGAIAWLGLNFQKMPPIHAGLVLSTMGDESPLKYKRSRGGNLEIDQVASHVLRNRNSDAQIFDFQPMGYDETHFSSPGFDLPIGRLMRGIDGQFPEYHTSGDSPEFVSSDALADSLEHCLQIVDVLEHNRTYRNLRPYGEPRLGPTGLYRGYGEPEKLADLHEAVLWVLNQSDGSNSLLDIADKSGVAFHRLHDAAVRLVDCQLLAPVESDESERVE